MWPRLEGAKNHLVSVTEKAANFVRESYPFSVFERALGFKRGREIYCNEFRPDPNTPLLDSYRILALAGSTMMGLFHVGIPFLDRLAWDEINGIRIDREHTKPYEYTSLLAIAYSTGPFIDIAADLVTLSLMHDPVQAVTFKMGANVASEVVGDIAVKASGLIRHFRPTSHILAV